MAEPLLEARGITKRYGHVRALDGADFSAFAGEVVALIGDNGAGKSTLVKALSGTLRPGRRRGSSLRASRFPSLGPLDAQRHGIETVYPDLALGPDLDAARQPAPRPGTLQDPHSSGCSTARPCVARPPPPSRPGRRAPRACEHRGDLSGGRRHRSPWRAWFPTPGKSSSWTDRPRPPWRRCSAARVLAHHAPGSGPWRLGRDHQSQHA